MKMITTQVSNTQNTNTMRSHLTFPSTVHFHFPVPKALLALASRYADHAKILIHAWHQRASAQHHVPCDLIQPDRSYQHTSPGMGQDGMLHQKRQCRHELLASRC